MCLIFYLINKEHRILCTFNLFKISIIVSHLNPNLYFRFFFPSEPRCVKVTCLPPPFHTSSLSSPDIRAAAFSNIVTVRWGDTRQSGNTVNISTLCCYTCHHSCHTIYCLLNWGEINKETVIKTSANTEVKWIHQTVYIHMSHVAAEPSDIIKIHD